MVPARQSEPMERGSASAAAMRGCVYGALAILLTGCVWLRFNDQIASLLPALAAPAALTNQTAADLGTRALVELPLLAPQAAFEAAAQMNLSGGDAGLLAQALQRGQLRLVRLPLVDAGAAPSDGAGRAVTVSAGGYTTLVRLGRQPVIVAVPIGPVGEIAFTTPDQGGVGIGALTLSGLVRLPDIRPGQVIDVGVIAQ